MTSRRPLTLEARVRSQDYPYEICCLQIDTGKFFFESLRRFSRIFPPVPDNSLSLLHVAHTGTQGRNAGSFQKAVLFRRLGSIS